MATQSELSQLFAEEERIRAAASHPRQFMFTIEETAIISGRTVRTLRYHIRKGNLPAVRAKTFPFELLISPIALPDFMRKPVQRSGPAYRKPKVASPESTT